jgi:hypothetical protein
MRALKRHISREPNQRTIRLPHLLMSGKCGHPPHQTLLTVTQNFDSVQTLILLFCCRWPGTTRRNRQCPRVAEDRRPDLSQLRQDNSSNFIIITT